MNIITVHHALQNRTNHLSTFNMHANIKAINKFFRNGCSVLFDSMYMLLNQFPSTCSYYNML